MSSAPDLEPVWTLKQLARVCACSTAYLRKCIRNGALAVHRRGRLLRIAAPEDALPRIIEADGKPRARADLDRRLEHGLTAREEMWAAEYDKEEAEREAARRKLWETA